MLLITQPRVGTSHNEILALQMAAHERGWDVFPADTSWRLPEDLIASKVKGVPYGSQIFCEVIAQQMGWVLKQNKFDWLAKLPKDFLHRQVDFMTLKEAKTISTTKFIKPADDKCFPAKVYEPGELVTHPSIPDDTPTLVSDVVQFDLEYRTFVSQVKPETWSNYLFYGEINEPNYHKMVDKRYEDPRRFVSDLMILTSPQVPSVIDVGTIRGVGMAVIETNPAWASGLYGCDPDSVLEVLEVSCDLA